MKIFISHASANKAYGDALLDLLLGLNVSHEEIIYTSNVAYGVPNGDNIFEWLKKTIRKKPYVIYLLSEQYYESIACLNEMGAAWIVGNESSVIFTPKFNISSPQFQNGALDPRKIGFYINSEDRLQIFIEQLRRSFPITNNSLAVSQRIRAFIDKVNSIANEEKSDVGNHIETSSSKNKLVSTAIEEKTEKKTIDFTPKPSDKKENKLVKDESDTYQLFLNNIKASKFKDEELLLLHYLIDTSKVRLMTGWKEDTEIQNIKVWEDISELNNQLSSRYPNAIRHFEIRKYIEVSEYTSSGNPKEFRFKPEIEENLFDLPEDIIKIIQETVKRNSDEPLPF